MRLVLVSKYETRDDPTNAAEADGQRGTERPPPLTDDVVRLVGEGHGQTSSTARSDQESTKVTDGAIGVESQQPESDNLKHAVKEDEWAPELIAV